MTQMSKESINAIPEVVGLPQFKDKIPNALISCVVYSFTCMSLLFRKVFGPNGPSLAHTSI